MDVDVHGKELSKGDVSSHYLSLYLSTLMKSRDMSRDCLSTSLPLMETSQVTFIKSSFPLFGHLFFKVIFIILVER